MSEKTMNISGQFWVLGEEHERLMAAFAKALGDKDREIGILRRQIDVARDAARILRTGMQRDPESFTITFEEYPYSDSYGPEDGDFGEEEQVGTLISFLNIFSGRGDKPVAHYQKDPEEQETLARQARNCGW